MVDPKQRRRYPRVPSQNVVLLQELEADAEEELAKTAVVGLGGCSVRSRRPVEPGTFVRLMISVADHVVRTEAHVVYTNPTDNEGFEMGLEFLRLTDLDRGRLAGLLGS